MDNTTAVLSPAYGLVVRDAAQARHYLDRGRDFVLHNDRLPVWCAAWALRERGYTSAQVRLTGGGIALVNL